MSSFPEDGESIMDVRYLDEAVVLTLILTLIMDVRYLDESVVLTLTLTHRGRQVPGRRSRGCDHTRGPEYADGAGG